MNHPKQASTPTSEVFDQLARETFRKFRPYKGNPEIGQLQERLLETLYRAVVVPGDVVVDVGAHRGRHTFPLANAVAESGSVWAFEAIPELHQRLQQMMEERGLAERVTVIPCALGRESGREEYCVVENDLAQSGLQAKGYYPKGGEPERIRVDVTTLDHAVADGLELRGRRLRFIKLDVEGGEFDVLRGAGTTLREHRPLVVFESGKDAPARVYGYTKEEFFEFFEGVGYRLRDILGGPFRIEDWDEFQPWYVVAYPEEQEAEISGALGLAIANQLIGFSWPGAEATDGSNATSESSAHEKVRAGWKALGRGDPEGARAAVAGVAESDPQYCEAMTVVARAFRGERDWSGARVALDRAIEVNPSHSLVMRELAWLCLRTNSPEEARDAAGRACDLAAGGHDELFAHASDVLGVCERRLGNPSEAIAAGQRAIELLPDCAVFHRHLADSFAEAGDQSASESHRRMASDLEPDGSS